MFGYSKVTPLPSAVGYIYLHQNVPPIVFETNFPVDARKEDDPFSGIPLMVSLILFHLCVVALGTLMLGCTHIFGHKMMIFF